MKKTSQNPPIFPKSLVVPVYNFLTSQLVKLSKRRKLLEKEDPFHDLSMVDDKSAPDAMAEEQVGHVRTTALQLEVSKRIIQTKRALSRIKIGKYGICTDCGKMIDTDRLMVYPDATLCVSCGRKKEKQRRH